MDCKDVADKIWLYVEGDLTPRKQDGVARHIASCPGCAGLVQEATNSQQWLRSSEPARFDDAVLDLVRKGARQKIAALRISRFEALISFAWLNWKPLIIACPVALLVCWLALHLAFEIKPDSGQRVQALESDGSGSGDVLPRTSAPLEPASGAGGKYSSMTHRKRRIARHVQAAPQPELADPEELIANGATHKPLLRIEIQTQDPDVRIIWFASPGDGSAPFGPDR